MLQHTYIQKYLRTNYIQHATGIIQQEVYIIQETGTQLTNATRLEYTVCVWTWLDVCMMDMVGCVYDGHGWTCVWHRVHGVDMVGCVEVWTWLDVCVTWHSIFSYDSATLLYSVHTIDTHHAIQALLYMDDTACHTTGTTLYVDIVMWYDRRDSLCGYSYMIR